MDSYGGVNSLIATEVAFSKGCMLKFAIIAASLLEVSVSMVYCAIVMSLDLLG